MKCNTFFVHTSEIIAMEDFTENKPDSYSWKTPQVVVEYSCQKLIEQGKVIILRLLPLILIVEYALYSYLKIVLPDEMEPKSKLLKPFLFVFLYAAGGLLAMFVVYPRVRRRFGGSNRITEKWFKWSDKQIYWKWVLGYWIEDNEEFPGLKQIFFKTKHRLYAIFLPKEDSQHHEILQFIDSHVPLIEPDYPEKTFTLSRGQLWFCWSFTIIISILAAALFIMFLPNKFMFFSVFGIFLGLGTISMILIFGKKFLKDRQFSYAFVLNMAAFMLFMTIVVLAELYKYHKIIEGH